MKVAVCDDDIRFVGKISGRFYCPDILWWGTIEMKFLKSKIHFCGDKF